MYRALRTGLPLLQDTERISRTRGESGFRETSVRAAQPAQASVKYVDWRRVESIPLPTLRRNAHPGPSVGQRPTVLRAGCLAGSGCASCGSSASTRWRRHCLTPDAHLRRRVGNAFHFCGRDPGQIILRPGADRSDAWVSRSHVPVPRARRDSKLGGLVAEDRTCRPVVH